jgi:pyruvate/2-oxoglutarate dehydrogenase complex dihydrolipoamide acyltransferase (E2) component
MADSTEANEAAPAPESADPGTPEAPDTPSPGWYPDPNAGGANLMRYWDGSAWTDRVQGGSEVSATRRTADERKVILSQQLQTAAARGLRIESQSDFQAVLVEGKPVNHTLHAILTIFTCLLWGIVWAIIAATGGESRQMVVVDEFGNVIWQKLGKA